MPQFNDPKATVKTMLERARAVREAAITNDNKQLSYVDNLRVQFVAPALTLLKSYFETHGSSAVFEVNQTRNVCLLVTTAELPEIRIHAHQEKSPHRIHVDIKGPGGQVARQIVFGQGAHDPKSIEEAASYIADHFSVVLLDEVAKATIP